MRLHLKLNLAYYTEKVHRYVFDNIYVHFDYTGRRGFTKKERLILVGYKILFKLNPKFRRIVRDHKELFKRAYRLRLLSAQYFYLYHKFLPENYKRYN